LEKIEIEFDNIRQLYDLSPAIRMAIREAKMGFYISETAIKNLTDVLDKVEEAIKEHYR